MGQLWLWKRRDDASSEGPHWTLSRIGGTSQGGGPRRRTRGPLTIVGGGREPRVVACRALLDGRSASPLDRAACAAATHTGFLPSDTDGAGVRRSPGRDGPLWLYG
jgi:hypothetical protein